MHVRLQAQYVPLNFGGHMFLELDYLAGPGGLGVQGVIGDCPTALVEWSRSLQWCVALRTGLLLMLHRSQRHRNWLLYAAQTAAASSLS